MEQTRTNGRKTNGRKSPVLLATITGDTSLKRMSLLMKNFNVGSVVVTREDKPVGIVTDRDLALVVGNEDFDRDSLVASDIMHTPITTIEWDASLLDIVTTMREQSVYRLPVVRDGDLVDVLSIEDVVELVHGTLEDLTDAVQQGSPHKLYT